MTETSSSLRYVVLRHEGVAEPHFDLMFETSPGSMLATWRSTDWPVTKNSTLTPLPDHRAAYLTYEGPLSGNRGVVRRIASGNHRVEQNDSRNLIVILATGDVLRLPRA
jgi:hypothetical protein